MGGALTGGLGLKSLNGGVFVGDVGLELGDLQLLLLYRGGVLLEVFLELGEGGRGAALGALGGLGVVGGGE